MNVILWPPRPPGITHLNLFLYRYVKNNYYQIHYLTITYYSLPIRYLLVKLPTWIQIRGTNEFKSRITETIQTVGSAFNHRTCLEIQYKLDELRIEILEYDIEKKKLKFYVWNIKNPKCISLLVYLYFFFNVKLHFELYVS